MANVTIGASGIDLRTVLTQDIGAVLSMSSSLIDFFLTTGEELRIGDPFSLDPATGVTGTVDSIAVLGSVNGSLEYQFGGLSLSLAQFDSFAYTSAFLAIALAGDDTITGGPGNDLLAGGGGNDRVSCAATQRSAIVNLAAGTGTKGGTGTDTLRNIENVTGSAFNDTHTGDGNNNVLFGGAGSATLSGIGGNNTLDGGTGNSTATYSERDRLGVRRLALRQFWDRCPRRRGR